MALISEGGHPIVLRETLEKEINDSILHVLNYFSVSTRDTLLPYM